MVYVILHALLTKKTVSDYFAVNNRGVTYTGMHIYLDIYTYLALTVLRHSVIFSYLH